MVRIENGSWSGSGNGSGSGSGSRSGSGSGERGRCKGMDYGEQGRNEQTST